MTTDEIFDKVQDIIAEQFSVEPETVTPGSALEDDLGADSVDLVDLAVTLEQEFNLPETEESVLGTIRSALFPRILSVCTHQSIGQKQPKMRFPSDPGTCPDFSQPQPANPPGGTEWQKVPAA